MEFQTDNDLKGRCQINDIVYSWKKLGMASTPYWKADIHKLVPGQDISQLVLVLSKKCETIADAEKWLNENVQA